MNALRKHSWLWLGILSGGWTGKQSALFPAGDHAERINELWWIFFFVTVAIYVVVVLLTAIAALRRKSESQVIDAKRERRMTRVVGGSVGLTTVILFALMVSDFFTGRAMHRLQDSNPLTIEVTGHRWWWEVKYKDPSPSNMLVTANEIHVPVGKSVRFELKSTDVIHSFWAPNFNGKKDAIPGHPSTNWFRANREGEYRGQCAEFCGYQHAHMRFVIVADAEPRFQEWRNQASQRAVEPKTDEQKRGQQVFLNGTCVMCHTISGTTASATVGPNLTHIASRKLIGSASFTNSAAALREWILNAQHFKPGVAMPQQNLRSEDADQLVAYLGSLK
jgi:cytochrome c oxidase subunit II